SPIRTLVALYLAKDTSALDMEDQLSCVSARERLEAQHAPFPLSKVVNEPRPDRRKRRSGLGSLTATRLLGRSRAPCRTPHQHYDCVTTSAVLMTDPEM